MLSAIMAGIVCLVLGFFVGKIFESGKETPNHKKIHAEDPDADLKTSQPSPKTGTEKQLAAERKRREDIEEKLREAQAQLRKDGAQTPSEEKTRLEKLLKDKKRRIQEQNEQLKKNKSECSKLKSERDKFKKKLEKKPKGHVEQQRTLVEISKKLDAFRAENAELQQQLEQTQNKLKQKKSAAEKPSKNVVGTQEEPLALKASDPSDTTEQSDTTEAKEAAAQNKETSKEVVAEATEEAVAETTAATNQQLKSLQTRIDQLEAQKKTLDEILSNNSQELDEVKSSRTQKIEKVRSNAKQQIDALLKETKILKRQLYRNRRQALNNHRAFVIARGQFLISEEKLEALLDGYEVSPDLFPEPTFEGITETLEAYALKKAQLSKLREQAAQALLLQAELDALRGDVDDANTDEESSDAEALNAKIKASSAAVAHNLILAKEQITALEVRLSNHSEGPFSETSFQQLETRLSDLQEALTKSQDANEHAIEVEAKNAQLQNNAKEHLYAQSRAEALAAQQTKAIADLETRDAGHRKKREALKKKVFTARQEVREQESTLRKANALQEAHDEALQTVEKLTAEVTDLQESIDANSAPNMISLLATDLEEKLAEHQKMTQKVEVLDAENASSRKEISNLKSLLSTLRSSAESSQSIPESKDTSEELAEALQSLESLSQELTDRTVELSEHKTESASLSADLQAQLQTQIQANAEAKSEAKAELDAAKLALGKSRKGSEKDAGVPQDTTQQDAEIANLQAQLESIKENDKTIQTARTTLQEELDAAQKQISALDTQLSDALSAAEEEAVTPEERAELKRAQLRIVTLEKQLKRPKIGSPNLLKRPGGVAPLPKLKPLGPSRLPKLKPPSLTLAPTSTNEQDATPAVSSQLEKALAVATDKISALEAELKQTQNNAASMSSLELPSTNSPGSKSDKEASTLEGRIERLQKRNETLKTARKTLRAELETAQSSLKKSAANSSTQGKLDEALQTIKTLKTDLKERRASAGNARQKERLFNTAQKRIQTLEKKIERLSKRRSSKKDNASLEAVNAHIQTLETELLEQYEEDMIPDTEEENISEAPQAYQLPNFHLSEEDQESSLQAVLGDGDAIPGDGSDFWDM